MNKVILVGNLTRDPEKNSIASGKEVCKFSIAVNRRFTNAEGTREADYFNISVWGATADSCNKYLKKGSKVSICGRIQTGSYEAQDGTKRYTFDIMADEVNFLSTKSEEEKPYHISDKPSLVPEKEFKKINKLKTVEDNDLPF